LQALIAYLLTALSVLGVGKKYCQKGTDALLKRRAKKNNTKAPHDVLRREAVLDEHAITKRKGGRRISTVLQLAGDLSSSSGSGDVGDIELSIAAAGSIASHLNPMQRADGSNAELKKKVASLEKTVARLMKHLSLTDEMMTEDLIADTASVSIKSSSSTRKKIKKKDKKKKGQEDSELSTATATTTATATVHVDKSTGRRYSYDATTGVTAWL
jgi:hypothetical protein